MTTTLAVTGDCPACGGINLPLTGRRRLDPHMQHVMRKGLIVVGEEPCAGAGGPTAEDLAARKTRPIRIVRRPETGEWVFVARWDVPRGPGITQLRVEAADQLDKLAAASGVRIVGTVTWAVSLPYLHAHADAEPLSRGVTTVNPTTSTAARDVGVWWLTHHDLPGEAVPADEDIADRLNITVAAVVQARATRTDSRAYRPDVASTALRARVTAAAATT